MARPPIHFFEGAEDSITNVRRAVGAYPHEELCVEGRDRDGRRYLLPEDWIDRAVAATGEPLEMAIQDKIRKHLSDGTRAMFAIPAGAKADAGCFLVHATPTQAIPYRTQND
jgi:hypothetical protein